MRTRLHHDAFSVSRGSARVELSSLDAGGGSWKRFSRGGSRPTPFGSQAVTVSKREAEEFLVVGSHHKTRTWTWRMRTGSLVPRVGADGAVAFIDDHRLSDLSIKPVQILDSARHDVTPAGLRWSVARQGGQWQLGLRLDDSKLPLPYVIDPSFTLRGNTGSNSAGAAVTSFALTMPAGVVLNDLLLAQVTVRNGTSTAITAPSGWTLIRREDTTTNLGQALYYHVAGASEPGSYTWTLGTADDASGGIIAYAGAINSAPIDVSSGGTGNSATVTAPGVTTTVANDMLVGFYGMRTNFGTRTFTAPTGMTERWDTSGGTQATSSESADVTQAAAGASGNKSATASGTGNYVAQLVAIKLDITNPTNSLSLSSVSPAGSAFLSGTTVYYRGAAAGNFQITNAVADGGSGPASSAFPALGGTTTGWTHTNQTITTPAGGPYVSTNSFSHTAGTTSSPTEAVQGADKAANTATTTLTFTNDNTAPTGSVTAPAASAIVHGNTVAVTSNSADGTSGVASVDFQRSPAGAGTWTSIGVDTTSSFSVNWDTTGVADGLYDLRAITTDNTGNTFTSATVANVRVDNTAPTGSVTAPAASANVTGSSVTVSSNSADGGSGVATATFQRSPAGLNTWTTIGTDSTSSYSVTWDTTAVADGLYDLRVVTTDNATNSFTSAVITNVRVDNTNPTGSVTAPASSANVRGNSVAVSSDSADAGSGVASAQFQRSPAGAGTWTTIGTDSTAPYSATWDTTAVSDGLYDLRVITTDNVGKTFTSSLVTNVRVDNTSPTGSLTAPASSANVTGSGVSLTSNSADGGSGVASADFQRSPAGAGSWTSIGVDTTSSFSVTWDTTAVADGLYDLRVVTTDNAGNTFTSALVTNVRVDNTNPTGSVTAPAASANVRGTTVAVSSDSADAGSGVASAQFQRSPAGAGTWTAIGSDSTAPYSVNWDTTAVTDGLYDLRVITTDNVGKTLTSALVTNVRVDNTSPTGSLTAPAPAANVRGSAVSLTSDSADGGSGVASASFQRSPAGAGSWTTISTDATGPYSATWDTTAVSDGLYDLRVVTTDNAGNSFTSTTVANVRVDNTSPTGSLTAPAASANVTGASVSVTSNSADGGSGVASAVFQRSPAGAGTWTTIGSDSSSPYSVSWDTTAVSDGLYDLRVVTTDNAGNTFTSALVTNVRVDNTNPTGAVTAPAASASVGGASVTVSSDSADAGSGVASAQFQRSPAGAGTWTTIGTDSSAPYSATWDTTAVSDGLYDLRVITTDNVGKTFTSALVTNVRVDNTNPTGSITAPAASSSVRGSAVAVSSNSADGGSGVASTTFQRSPAGTGTWTTIGSDSSAPYSVSWDTTPLSDGLYDLRVVTTDVVGNSFTSALVTNVRVDNTNPTGSLTAPAASANVRGSAVSLTSDSADGGSGVASAAFQRSPAGAGTWTTISTDSSAPYAASWDTTAVSDGLYDLRVVTTDNAGNTFNSATVANVRVDNTNPTGSLTAPAASANVRGSAVSVSSSSADGGSGVASAVFQRSPAGAGTWTTIGSDSSSPYSVSWDTTAVSDGLYDLRVVTTDNAGNTFTSALVTNVRVDNTSPTGSVTGPASGASVGGSAVNVTSDSADGGSGVASAAFQRSPAGAGTWTTISTDSTPPYAATWDTTAVADGLYDLRVVTTDNAGNAFTSVTVANVRVDNTAPAGAVTAPTAGSSVGGAAVTVSSNSSDGGSGVFSAQFQRSPAGAGTWTTISTDTAAPYSVSWDTTPLTDGLYDLRVITTDVVGNTFTSALTTNVRVDNTAPTGAVTVPSSSASVGGAAVTVSSNSADAGSGVASAVFQRSPAGLNTWTTISTDSSAPYSVSWDTTSLSDGLYDLRVVTTDAVGNTFNSALTTNVRVDNTAPTGSVTAPSAGANVRGSAVTVSSSSADGGSGVASATFQRSPAGTGTWTTIGSDSTAPYSVSWDTTPLSDGLYDLRVVTTDAVGNSFNSATVANVRVDNTSPTGSLTAPANGANVTGSAVSLTANSADGGSGVASTQFQRSPAGAGSWTTISTDSTAPYSASWDTTAVSDGLYDLRVVTTDNAGNTFNSAAVTNVRVDNTAPAGSVTAPSSGANVRGAAVTVSSNSADAGSGVASTLFQRSPAGAGTWTTIGSDSSAPYSVSWDTTAVSDGLYDLQVVTTDAVGNTFTSALTTNVRVDNTNPTGSVTAPASGASVGGSTVSVTSNSADAGSGVASAQFQRSAAGAGVWTTIATDSSAPYSATWDTTAVGDGLYDLRVITTDNVGNTFTSALTTNVRVDNTAPAGSVTAPASGSSVGGASVTVSSNSSDAGSGVASAQFERSPAGLNTWTTIGSDSTAPYSVSWDTTPLSDGLYDLRVVTTDAVGNSFTSALTTNVRVDNTAPTGAVTVPGSGASVGGAAVTVSSSSADGGSGVASAQFQRSPAGLNTWTTISTDSSAPYSVSWDTTSLSDGLYDLRVITSDNVGNSFTSALTTNVRVDNTNPTGSVTAPASGASVGGSTVSVTSNSADAGSGVASAQFQRSPAGAGSWTTISTDSTPPYAATWDTTSLSDGLYDLRVITTDNVGNTFTSALTTNVRVDNTAPSGSVTAPASGANVRGSAVTVSSNSTDAGSGVVSVAFQRSPAGAGTWTTIGTDTTAPYSTAWDTTAVLDGLYDLRAVTTDSVGNGFTSALVTNVRVDNTAPSGAMTAPVGGSYIGGSSVSVSSSASDGGSGVASVSFERSPAGAGTWTTIGSDSSAPYSVTWNTTSLVDGDYDVRAVTTDNAGNSSPSSAVTVHVDNTAPSGVVTAPASGASVGGSAVSVTSNSADSGAGVASTVFQRSPAGAGTWTTIGSDSTPPYGVTWDTTSLTDGLYDLRVVTTDSVGNAFTSALTTNVRVDNTAPSGAVTAPSSGANVRGSSVTVSSSSADGGSGVASATFQRSPAGLNTWSTIGSDSSAPYSVSWNTTSVSDGLYDLRVLTTDVVGNTFTSALTTNVRVDNTNPTGSVTTPADGAYVGGSAVTVSSDSSDSGSGVASVSFERSPSGAGSWTAIGSDSSGPYSASWDTTGLTDGDYDLRAVTTDAAGNSAPGAAVSVHVDNTAPTGSVTSPAAGASVGGSNVSITSDSADSGSGVASAVFQRSPAGAGSWTTISTDSTPPYVGHWDTTLVANGLYDLRVVTTDNVGNSFTSALATNVRVDNANPTGSITAPASGDNLRGTVSVDSDSADGGSGVASATFQRSPAGASTWTTIDSDSSAPYSVSWDTTSVVDGLYDLRVVTTDAVGNSFTSPLVTNVRVDNTVPGGGITAPAASAAVSGSSVTVSSDSSDTGSGVASAQFERSPAGAGTWTAIGTDSAAPYSAAWNTTGLSDGSYDLRVVTTDVAGNTFASAPVTVTVDNTDPTGSITAPTASALVTGSAVTVSSDSADALAGVASAVFESSPAGAGTWTAIDSDSTAPYSVSWDTTSFSDGDYDLRVVTTDLAGNSSTSSATTVTVDNSAPAAPSLAFGSFTNASATGSTVYFRPGASGGFTVTASASDAQSGIANYGFPTLPLGWSDSGTGVSHGYTFTDSATTPGAEAVTATNGVGLTSPAATFTVAADSTAPSTSADCDGGACSSDWYTSSVSVSLSATDSGSGVDSIRYTTDGTDPSPVNGTVYTGAFDVAASTTVKYRAYDAVGNEEAVDSLAILVDSTAPTGSLTAPAAGADVRGTVSISSDSADSTSGVASVAFQRSPAGAGAWTTVDSDSTAPYSVNWDTTSLADGDYDLRAVTTDVAGNAFTSAARTVTVDNTAPSGSLTDPGANLRGTVSLDGSVADATSGVASVAFQRAPAGAGTWTMIASDSSAPYAASWDTTDVADGLYDLRLLVTDEAGNTFASAVVADRLVDNTAPGATMTSPGTSLRGTVSLQSSTSDGGSGMAGVTYQRSPAGAGTWTAIGTSSSSPYSLSFDTTSVADGLYDLRAVATDAAGNQSISAAVTNIRVDNTAPTATMDDPGTLSGTASLSASAGDSGSGVASVAFRYSPNGAGTWTPIGTDTTAPYAVNWDTTTVDDGRYDLDVVVTDAAGNVTTSAAVANRTVSNHPPTVSITAPGAYLNAASPSTVSITANASANQTGVQSVAFFTCSDSSLDCSTGSWLPLSVDSTDPFSASWNQSLAPEGNRALRAVVSDNLDITGEDVHNVLIDRTAPSGGSVDYTDGYDATGSVTVSTANGSDSGSGVDAGSAVLERDSATLDGGSCDTFAGNWSAVASPDTSVASGACYRYRYRVSDLAGNEATFTSPNLIKEDSGNPTASISDPGPNLRGTVTLDGNGSDALSGIASVAFQRSPAGAGTWTTVGTDTSAPYSASFDTTSVADGLYDFRSVATDLAGNQASSTPVFSRRVDNTAPSATMEDPGSPLRGTVLLGSDVADGGSGITSPSYEYSPAGQDSWTTTPDAWDTTLVADGLYDLRVVATDVAGNTTASTPVTGIRVDNTAPSVSLDDPGSPVSGSITLSVAAGDGGSGLAHVTYQRSPGGADNWTTIGIANGAPFSVGFDTTTVADGDYDFRAIATDAAGNSTTSSLVADRTVDNTPADVAFSAPLDGAFVNASAPDPFTVQATTTDSDVQQIAFFACSNASAGCSSGTWNLLDVDTSAPFSASWTLPPTDGARALRALTTDTAGNHGNAVVTVTVDRLAPSGGSVSYADGYVSGAVAVDTDPGTDSLSGVDLSSAVIQRQSASLSGNSCGAFAGSWSPISSPDATVAGGNCYRYRYVVADNAGNVAVYTSANVVRVDAAAPSISFDAGSANLRGTVALDATSSDPHSGVASVAFQVSPAGAGTWTTVSTDTSSPYTTSLDTTTLADGDYDLRAVSTDVAGNSAADTTSRLVDNTAPSGSVTQPAGSVVYGTVAVASSSADAGSGVASVGFEISPAGAGTWSPVGSDTTAPYSVALDTTGLADGDYDLRATTTDAAGNTFTSPVKTVTADNVLSAPGLSFSSFDNAAATASTIYYRPGAAGGFSVTAVPTGNSILGHVDFPALGPGWSGDGSDSAAPYRADYAFDGSAVESGPQDVTVVDSTGRTTPGASFSVDADADAPTTAIACDGGACSGGWYAAPVSVSLSAGDAGSGLAEIRYTTDGSTPTPMHGTVYSAPFPVGSTATVRFRAYDRVGNEEAVGSQTVQVDQVAPTASLDDPGALLSGTVQLSASASDSDSGVDSVRFERAAAGSGTWTTISTDPSAPYTADLDASALPDGAYDLRAVATDAAGNSTASSVVTSRVDTTDPVVSLDDPGTAVHGTVGLTVTASDDGGIDTVAYEYAVAGSGTWLPTPAAWNTNGLAEGMYDLRATATDFAGHSTTSATVTVLVDNTAPVALMDDPGSPLQGVVTLTADHSSDSSGTVSKTFQYSPAAENSWVTIPSSDWDTTDVPDGRYDVRVRVTDQAGNVTVSSPVRNRAVANSSVSVAIVSPEDSVSSADADPFTIEAMSPDAADLTGVEFFTCDNSSANCSTGAWVSLGTDTTEPYTAGWNVPADGNRALKAVATANTSATGSDTLNVLVDRTAPAGGSVSYVDGFDNGPITITGTPGADSGSGLDLDSVYFERDEGTLAGGSCSFGGNWQPVSSPDAAIVSGHCYRYRYRVPDLAGNVAAYTSTHVVKRDNDAPAVSLDDPGAAVKGTVSLTATASDAAAGVTSVRFERSPAGAGTWTTIATDSAAPWTASFDTTSVADGAYDLRAVATDGAGNQSTSLVASRLVDNTQPSLGLTGLADGDRIFGSIPLSATSSDSGSGLTSVTFRARSGAGAWTTLATLSTPPPFNVSWDSTTVPDGAAEVQVVATDTAGNQSSITRSVAVDNDPPTVSLGSLPAVVRGVLLLGASASADTVSVAFDYRPQGGPTWTRITTDTSSPYGTSLNTGTLADGHYEFRAVATDAASHTTASTTGSALVDNSVPAGALTMPVNGTSTSASTIHLAASASDAASGVVAVTFQERPAGGVFADLATVLAAPYEANWNRTGLANGSYEVRAVVVDAAGNVFVTPAVAISLTSSPSAPPPPPPPPPSGPPAGPTPAPFTFSFGKVTLSARRSQAFLSVPIKLTGAAKIQTTLVRGKKKIKTWRNQASVGTKTLKLVIAKRLLKKGSYSLTLVATSADGRHVQRKVTLRVPKRIKTVKPAKRR